MSVYAFTNKIQNPRVFKLNVIITYEKLTYLIAVYIQKLWNLNILIRNRNGGILMLKAVLDPYFATTFVSINQNGIYPYDSHQNLPLHIFLFVSPFCVIMRTSPGANRRYSRLSWFKSSECRFISPAWTSALILLQWTAASNKSFQFVRMQRRKCFGS